MDTKAASAGGNKSTNTMKGASWSSPAVMSTMNPEEETWPSGLSDHKRLLNGSEVDTNATRFFFNRSADQLSTYIHVSRNADTDTVPHDGPDLVQIAAIVSGVGLVIVVVSLICFIRYRHQLRPKSVLRAETNAFYQTEHRNTYYHQDSMISVPENQRSSHTASMQEEERANSISGCAPDAAQDTCRRKSKNSAANTSSLQRFPSEIRHYYELDTSQEDLREVRQDEAVVLQDCDDGQGGAGQGPQTKTAVDNQSFEETLKDDFIYVENQHYHF